LVSENITYYEKALGSKPFIFVLKAMLYSGFPTTQSIEVAKRSIIPYVYAWVGDPWSISPSFDVKEIAQGKYDRYIKAFAKGAAEFGKNYGNFFLTTMEEMNGKWFVWGKNPNFVKAWIYIWQIFEEQGANQYATWVWEVYCPERLPAGWADDPELYYPGNEYVDWIGLNAFSVIGKSKDDSLAELMQYTYRQMCKKHPQKPIMQSEFGRTNADDQPRWLLRRDLGSHLQNSIIVLLVQ